MGKILIIKGADFSQVAVDTVTPIENGLNIIISLNGSVTIIDTSAETIYYTTDGTIPTASSTQYTGAFTVMPGTIVKAISVYPSGVKSEVVSKTYIGTILTKVADCQQRLDTTVFWANSIINGDINGVDMYVLDVSAMRGRNITITASDFPEDSDLLLLSSLVGIYSDDSSEDENVRLDNTAYWDYTQWKILDLNKDMYYIDPLKPSFMSVDDTSYNNGVKTLTVPSTAKWFVINAYNNTPTISVS